MGHLIARIPYNQTSNNTSLKFNNILNNKRFFKKRSFRVIEYSYMARCYAGTVRIFAFSEFVKNFLKYSKLRYCTGSVLYVDTLIHLFYQKICENSTIRMYVRIDCMFISS